MPFALLIIGALLLIAAARGTQGDLFNLLRDDFTGPNNFIYWMAAVLTLGAIGYIPKLKPLSVALLTLVVLVLFLKRGDSSSLGGGFFDKLTAGLKSTETAQANSPATVGQTAGNPAAGASPNSGATGIGTGLAGMLSTLLLPTDWIQ